MRNPDVFDSHATGLDVALFSLGQAIEMMMKIPAVAIHTATLPGINEDWGKLRQFSKPKKLPRGFYFNPYEGEPSFFYIEKGTLLILHVAENGLTRNMIYMKHGSLVNIAHALGREITSFIDVGCRFYCLSDVILWVFPARLLKDKDFINEHTDLIINLMNALGVRLLLMHNMLSFSGTGSALVKVARFCWNISEAHNNALNMELNLPLSELANLLGIHRVSLFRAVRKLKEEDALLELTYKNLRIANLEKLKKFARE